MDTELVRRFLIAKDAHHTAAETAKKAKADYEEREREIMEEMREEGVKSVKLVIPGYNNDKPVQLTDRKPTIYGQIIDEDAALEFFESSARVDEFVGTKIHAQRLNQFVREMIQNRTPLPDGIAFREDEGLTVTKRAR